MTGIPASRPLPELLQDVYYRLLVGYGPQGWWPADSRFEVIVGAILTQSTAWVNVEKALGSMRAADCWSFEGIASLSESELAVIIRSSGYFNAKARKLRSFASHLLDWYDGNLDRMFDKGLADLREELLSIHGIGQETADDILVYAAGMPSFVMDSYTRRVVDRLGITPEGRNPGYSGYQALFQNNLAADTPLFNEFHALLDHHAKVACLKTGPRCHGCCLADICVTGAQTAQDG